MIHQLWEIPWEGAPICLDLTPEAKDRWITWHDAHCAETEQDALSPFQRAAYNKLLGACARLALIHAVASDLKTTNVDIGSIEAAITLVTYFKLQVAKIARLLCGPNPKRWNGVKRRSVTSCRYVGY